MSYSSPPPPFEGFHFELLAEDPPTKARRGRLHTPHGPIETPVFMPVGTLGSVKAVGPDDLERLGAQVVLGNTYHLMLRPGEGLVERLGGLHRFMAFGGALLTDSGGFQVYSLAQRRKISEEGVHFASHLDGRPIFLSPEDSMRIQQALGADIAMAFDECPPVGADMAYLEDSLARTTRWLHRCRAAWTQRDRQALFGIVQGGLSEVLRKRHSEEVCSIDLPGYALGGFSVGEEKEAMHAGVAYATPLLPRAKPRYLMGVGAPEDLVAGVCAGVDMFDCVLPTRCARTGLLFTSEGKLNIRNARYQEDERPLDALCGCYVCRTFSRAYLRHLFQSREVLALRLNSLHNLHFLLQLMAQMRKAIEEGRMEAFVKAFISRPSTPA
ncbi:MAG: tRNA guanosine(34) transglycosylase Tgt [Cystobacterineae bacterium]|nr:tRNA guanosine(34) transglycosylase Tgt [Cystobacterineae bacterium]